MEQRNLRVVGVIAVATALAVGGVALGLAVSNSTSPASASTSASCAGSAPKLTVQGTGDASAAPDILTVSPVASATMTAPSSPIAIWAR